MKGREHTFEALKHEKLDEFPNGQVEGLSDKLPTVLSPKFQMVQ